MTLSTSLRILVTSSVLTCCAFAVQAQPHETRPSGQYQRANAEHLAQLKEKLNLAPDQQAAWEQYQTAAQPAAGQRVPHEDVSDLSDEQKAELRTQFAAQRQAKQAASKDFYAQLNPEQQAVFDAETQKKSAQRESKKRSE